MQSLKFSNYVAKEIQNQHLLKENIKFVSRRNHSRSAKLRQYYSIPQSTNKKFYVYSSIHGNQFLLKDKKLKATCAIIFDIVNEANAILGHLWNKNKEYSKKTSFPWQKRLSNWGLMWIVFLFILLCFPSVQSHIKQNLIYIMLSSVAIITAAIVSTTMLRHQYKKKDYDEAAIVAIAKILSVREKDLIKLGIHIRCDELITWICFFHEETQKMDKITLSKSRETNKLSLQIKQDMQNRDADI